MNAPSKIDVVRVSKHFGAADAPPVLRDIDLGCAENEFVCLLGRHAFAVDPHFAGRGWR